MNFCPNCGFSFNKDMSSEKDVNLNFCPSCGHNLTNCCMAPASSQDVEAKTLEFLRQKNYIEAIRFAGRTMGKDLKSAKGFVDEVAQKNGIDVSGHGAALNPLSPKGRFIAYLVGAAFLALMICSAGIAIVPQLGLVAKPMLCNGNLAIVSGRLYTPPGQAGVTVGVSRSFRCPDGRDQTFPVLGISMLIYTVGIMVLLYLRRLFKIIRGSAKASTMPTQG